MALTKVDQTMVSDQVFGRRRLNINGGMDINQRGTTNSVTNAYGGPDRYKLSSSGSIGVFQLSQSGSHPDGFHNSMHVNCTTADASPSADEYVILAYQFEGFDCQPLKFGTSSAEQVTISFYVKTNKTGTYNVELYAPDNSSNPYAGKQYTVSSADTWEQKIVTLPCSNSAEIADDNTAGLIVHFWLGSGTTYTSGSASDGNFHNTTANRAAGNVNIADSTSNSFRITGIQVEAGNNATPFEYRSQAEELAMCERYLEVCRSSDDGYLGIWGSQLNTTTNWWQGWQFRQEKRVKPTISLANSCAWQKGGTNENVYEGVSSVNFQSNSWFYFGGNAEGTVGMLADSEL